MAASRSATKRNPEQVNNTRVSVFKGHHLQTYIWEPDDTPRALLCLCHGVHEHMGRYEKLIDHLKCQGIMVFGMDLVGHGNSGGVRGHIDEIQSYVTDMMRYAEDMKVSYPNIPMFLMGHSMGGLIAVMLAIQTQHFFDGLLLSSPAVIPHPNAVGSLRKFVTRVLNLFASSVGVLTIRSEDLTSLPNEARAYDEDPLIVHALAKASWGSAMMTAIEQYERRVAEISLPLFIMHGSADQLVPMEASDLVYTNCTSDDKVLEVFIDSRHEILHDREQKRAHELISSWILLRIYSVL